MAGHQHRARGEAARYPPAPRRPLTTSTTTTLPPTTTTLPPTTTTQPPTTTVPATTTTSVVAVAPVSDPGGTDQSNGGDGTAPPGVSAVVASVNPVGEVSSDPLVIGTNLSAGGAAGASDALPCRTLQPDARRALRRGPRLVRKASQRCRQGKAGTGAGELVDAGRHHRCRVDPRRSARSRIRMEHPHYRSRCWGRWSPLSP